MFISSHGQSICAVTFSIDGLFASEVHIFCLAIDLFQNQDFVLFMPVAVVIISCELDFVIA